MAQKQLNVEEKKPFSVPHQLNEIHTFTNFVLCYLESEPFYGQKEINSLLISLRSDIKKAAVNFKRWIEGYMSWIMIGIP